MPKTDGFDYTHISASKRTEVQEETRRIHELLARSAENAVQIGLRLIVVRNTIGREHFQTWLDEEFRWSQSVASNLMRTASRFRELDCVNRFQPSALYALARKKVPDTVRQEAIDRARQGEFITKKDVEELLGKQTQVKSRRAPSPPAARVTRYLTKFVERLDQNEVDQVLSELTQLLRRLRKKLKGSTESKPAKERTGRRTSSQRNRRKRGQPARA